MKGMSSVGFLPIAGFAVALLVMQGLPARAHAVAIMTLPPPGSAEQLYPGCNSIALTFPDWTPSQAVVQAVTPAEAVQVVWRYNAAQVKWEGYAPTAPEASDLLTVDFLDAVWVCIREAAGTTNTPNLDSVTSWAYQIQELEAEGAVDALVASDYDLLVIDPTRSTVGSEDFDTAGLVARLHGRSKLVLAYIDIGEAEDYRSYWQADWEAPSAGGPGSPDFLLTVDPGGWSGDYPVAYWDQRWKSIVIYDEDSLLDMALDDGFDGIYMDWIEAYSDEDVEVAADAQGLDPAPEMVAFIREIRDYARGRHAGFLLVAQNAAELAQERPEYLGLIDGLAQEDLSFGGEADSEWGDPSSGDIPTSQEDQEHLIELFGLYQQAGLPIFCVDYALWEDNVRQAYDTAEQAGCLGYVSQTPLSRLTETPPPP
jgi:cysteinyl-tRNA synthetase